MNPYFQLGAAFAGLVLFAVVSLEGKDLAQEIGLIEEDEPVLVFTIPHPERFAGIKRAVVPDRIVRESDLGFALEGGRVYVQDFAAAGPLIKDSGWLDQPIQIVSLGVDEEEGAEEGGPHPLSDDERLARLRSLVKKKTLTRGEQMFVLAAMNDGIML